MPELNLHAIQNAPLLRLIEADATRPIAAYAADLGRDKSNTAKSIKLLRSLGLIDDKGLTDAGRAQLAAIARAEHGGEPASGVGSGDPAGSTIAATQNARGQWPYDKVRRNPANRPIDPATIPEMADAILGARASGGLLQRTLLTPPDANGVRMLLAGERRWLALCQLRDAGLLTDDLAWLAEGLPFEERAATDAEATLITIVENTSREGLNPLDDAEQLYRYHQLTGLSARQIAKLTGRSPADSNRGERDVQLKIKIAREATEGAKAEYRRTGSWDALRDSVTRPKPPEMVLTREQRLALAELRDLNRGGRDAPVPILPLAFTAEGARLQQYGLAVLTRHDRGDTAHITVEGIDYLEAEGLVGSIQAIRERLKFPPRYGHSDYTTAWLNVPTRATEPARIASPAPDPETEALRGIEPITATGAGYLARVGFVAGQRYARQNDRHNPVRRVSDFAPDLPDWKHGESTLADYLGGPVEHLLLPWLKPSPRANRYPQALIEVAPLKGGQGWVYGAGYSAGDVAHEERLNIVAPRMEAFPDRESAIAAGVDLILDSCGRNTKWKYPAGLLKWLDNPTPPGPHVVNGVDYLNSTRAREARLDLGLEPRKANSGGGGARPADQQAAQQHAAERVDAGITPEQAAADAEAEALLARARKTLEHNQDVDLAALATVVEPLLKAAGVAGPYSTHPEFPGAICCGDDPMISIDPDGIEAEPAMVAAAEILAEILNRALGHAAATEAG
jgi:ParB-like chromosome segregation protein Spo0J